MIHNSRFLTKALKHFSSVLSLHVLLLLSAILFTCITQLQAQTAATKVYYVQQSGTATSDLLAEINLNGTGGNTIATGATNFAQPFKVCVDKASGYIFVADGTATGTVGIVRYNLDGTGRTVIASPLVSPNQYADVAVGGNYLYYIIQSGTTNADQLVRCNLDGSNPVVLASGSGAFAQPTALAVDAISGYIYVADGTISGGGSKGIVRFNLDGSNPVNIMTPWAVTGTQYIGVAVSGNYVYVAQQSGTAANDQIIRTGLDGSNAVVLTSGASSFLQPMSIDVDAAAGYIVVADNAGTGSKGIVRFNIDGTNPVTLVAASATLGTNFTGIALDGLPTSPVPSITLGTSPTVCAGSTSASIAYSAATNSPTTYSIVWGPAAISAGFTNVTNAALPASPISITVPANAAAGSYGGNLTVSNGNVSSTGSTFTVTINASPSGSVVKTNVSCFGGSNGVINLTPTGGLSPYTFNWGGGISTEDRTGLSAGTYTVTITDANTCTGTVSTTITQPAAALSGSTVVTNVACFGGNTGAINLTPSGGTSPYTFLWNSGATTEDRTGLTAGTYSVTITDANSCQGTVSSIVVTQPATAVSGSTVVTNVACFGGSNGSINLTPTGGTSPYTFTWNSGATTEDRTGLAAGFYSVVITDANSCQKTISSIAVTQPAAALSGSTVVTNVACFGGNTGAINLTPSGGTSPYTFLWNSGATTEDRTGLTAGTYSVTITDANSCQATVSSISVTQPASPVSGSTVVTNVACFGGSNGSINLTPTGGTSPYTFTWNSGATTEDRTGLAAGTYSVTIRDANSCQSTLTGITVAQPAAALSGSTVVTNVACFGGNTGAINLTPSGGTSPYTFLWNSGATTEDRTGLTAGTYSVTITDANSCQATVSSIAVAQPAAALSGSTVVTNVACFGGSNGSINLTPTGGTSPYTFLWNSGATTEDRTGLTAGTYSVTITDANSCQKTISSIAVAQPAAALSGSTVVTNVACFGGSNGTINLTPTGGTSPYTFLWNSGATTEDRTGLAAGTYSVVITDANSCQATVSSITVAQPAAALSGSTVVTNVACFGGSNGSINLTPTGGTSPYTFLWNSGATTEDRTGLAAGTYSVVITDANSCQATVSSISVTQPTAISTSVVSTTAACSGVSNGAASISATGGTAPYTYAWSPVGGTSSSAVNLAAGSYSVTVTDNNGCTKNQAVTVSATTPTQSGGVAGSTNAVTAVTQPVQNAAGAYVDAGCNRVATIVPSGVNPVSGNVTVKVWIESAVPSYNTFPYVQRHYEITPATNAATATGTITLYFLQSEFDAFNAAAGSVIKLPTGPADATGISNLRIGKYTGSSSDNSGLPSTYSGTPIVIDPADNEVVWNATASRWEISFAVTGFSGFIVQTATFTLPVNWVSFTAEDHSAGALLKWQTANEVKVIKYRIEHSIDGVGYEMAGYVEASGKLSNVYTFLHHNAKEGQNFYRLVSIDADGKSTYSHVVRVNKKMKTPVFSVMSNPVRNKTVQVYFNTNTTCMILNSSGQVVWKQDVGMGNRTINLGAVAQGIYLLIADGQTTKLLVE